MTKHINQKQVKKQNCILARFKFPSGEIRPSTENGKRYWIIEIGCLGGGFEYKVKRNNQVTLDEAVKVFNKTLRQHHTTKPYQS